VKEKIPQVGQSRPQQKLNLNKKEDSNRNQNLPDHEKKPIETKEKDIK